MAVKWLRELDKEFPALAATARRLNAEDGFVMADRRKKDKASSGDESGKKSRDRDGDDARGARDADRKERGKRKSNDSDSDNGEDGEDSGSGRSGTTTSSFHKKRGRGDEWTDGSGGDQRRSSPPTSELTPRSHDGSPI